MIVQQTGGGAAIDPAGNSDVDADATGSTPLSVFNSLDGRITQVNWNGISGSTGNTINSADVDVRIEHVGGYSANTNTTQNSNAGAGGNAYQWSGTNGQQMDILFGTHGGSFSNDRTVNAAGLVLLNFGSAYTGVTIIYLDPGDNVLSTQSFAGTGDSQTPGSFGGADFFTGYVSSSQNIAKVSINLARNSGNSDISLDSLTYSTVPEPSSTALLGLGFLGLLLRRNRIAVS